MRDARRPAVTDMSDAWLLGRARELRAAVQSTSHDEQLAIIAELDALLAETKNRGTPLMVADLLRSAAMARLATTGLAAQAEPLVDELLAHTRQQRLPILRAGAHALQGKRLILAGKEDAALTEIARALAILDDPPTATTTAERRTYDRSMVTALTDCWQGLNELGLYETAEEVGNRSHRALRASASPHDITLQLFNLIEMLLAWAIRLERVRRDDKAREKYGIAASVAAAVEAPFTESLFRMREAPAIDQVGLIAAAAAFADPGADHIERLHRLFKRPASGQEKVLVAIALSRCLEQDARREEARDVLHAARDAAFAANAPASVRLNVDRELARFELAGRPGLPDAVLAYTSALEAELWEMRESRAAALQARRNHERLSAEHGAIAAQALQDPLTGLPNRRALDERLRALSSNSAAQPLAVALVDLDGFKGVNDNQSHAEGDDVLRVIASTLRDALRGDDFVARYGGDEFVVLLPGAPASAAALAMNRIVTAVDELPGHLSRGVTLSVGLVSMAPSEHPESVLARADAAMYEAKRGGGNQVSAATQDAGD
ncbi:MAG: diguanylate cyclase [Actinophytocola sp.]|nr:diguanylate cyclase [Actinophytocola sp.]